MTRTDVAQAESRLAAGRSQVLAAESNYVTSKATYRQVIGVEPGKLVSATPVDRLSPRALPQAIASGREFNPAVAAAMFGIDVAMLQVKINEGSLASRPCDARQIERATGSREVNTSTALRQFTGSVVGQLTVPIYQGGGEYSLIRQAKETLGQRRVDLETARDQVQANVVQSWGQLEAAKAQIQATQAQVDAAEIALNGVREEARVGQRTTLDVLNAQQELVNASVRRAGVTSAARPVGRVVHAARRPSGGSVVSAASASTTSVYDLVTHYQQVRDSWAGVQQLDGVADDGEAVFPVHTCMANPRVAMVCGSRQAAPTSGDTSVTACVVMILRPWRADGLTARAALRGQCEEDDRNEPAGKGPRAVDGGDSRLHPAHHCRRRRCRKNAGQGGRAPKACACAEACRATSCAGARGCTARATSGSACAATAESRERAGRHRRHVRRRRGRARARAGSLHLHRAAGRYPRADRGDGGGA